MSCFIIAEAGVNHNGSVERALMLVDAAAKAGADAVKFQTFRAEQLVVRGAPKAEYQSRNSGAGDQYSMLKALELPSEAYPLLFERCRTRHIEFMSTPFDIESAHMLCELGMRRLKVPSGEITNLPFLDAVGRLGLPIILSTGMSTLPEVKEAVDRIGRARSGSGHLMSGDALVLLHCTSNYPAAPEEANLRAMVTLHETFEVPAGYSDHTQTLSIPVAAAALGAAVIEKHFTLDCTLPGPDHNASLDPPSFASMVKMVREVEAGLGTGTKEPVASELPIRDLVRRSVTVTRSVRSGEALEAADLALLRPGSGIAPRELGAVIGRRAARDLEAGTTLHWNDLLS
jgi:N-acetylneuraminate synthase